MKIQLLLITFVTFIAIFKVDRVVEAKPLEDVISEDEVKSDDESVTKIDEEKIEIEEDKTERIVIEKLPEGEEKELKKDDAKQKKSQRNYPVYYVSTKVNGRFGKSVRAFTADEFYDMYPIH